LQILYDSNKVSNTTQTDRGVGQLSEMRVEIVDDTVHGAWQSKAANEQYKHQHVRKQRREPCHLLTDTAQFSR